MRPMVRDQLEARLAGRRLIVARSVWIVVVALTLGLYLFSIPLQFAYYQIVCSGAACPSDQISPTGLEQLQQAGLSLGFNAGYLTALNATLVVVPSVTPAKVEVQPNEWRPAVAGITSSL
jgi:hypothetical protein